MRHQIILAGIVVCLSFAQPIPTFAQSGDTASRTARISPGQLPLSAYSELPANEFVALSPSGKRIALVTIQGEQRALLIYALPEMILIGGARIGDAKVRDVAWAGEEYVLASTSDTRAVPLNGNAGAELLQGQVYDIRQRRIFSVFQRLPRIFRTMIGGADIRTIGGIPQIVFQGQEASDNFDVNLYAVNPETMNGRVLEASGIAKVNGYAVGAHGAALARSTYVEQDGYWSLQMRSRAGVWASIWSTHAILDPPTLEGVGPDGTSALVWAKVTEDGGWAPYLVSAEGVKTPAPFDVTPTGLIYHPLTKVLIGGRYNDGSGVKYVFIDPVAAAAWARIERAFGSQSPTLVSWSEDFGKVVVLTSGSHDSGTYHLVDMSSRQAQILGEEYPIITSDKVGEVTQVVYPASDGMSIPGYLTLPPGVTNPRNLPLVVMPHGGPASRDYMTFDWWAQAMASRGYAVLQPNFRGSDGLGIAHLEAGYGEWGRKMQTDLSDGVRWLASEGIVDRNKVCIVGGSYGGYAALAGPTLDQGVYRCAVSVAGVSDLRRMLGWTVDRAGRNNNPTTRYWNRFMGSEGANDRSLDQRSPALLAARADAPILLIHGRDDTVVPFTQTQAMADALRQAGKPYELVELPNEDHWLSRPETRRQMLDATIRFLETNNPPD